MESMLNSSSLRVQNSNSLNSQSYSVYKKNNLNFGAKSKSMISVYHTKNTLILFFNDMFLIDYINLWLFIKS